MSVVNIPTASKASFAEPAAVPASMRLATAVSFRGVTRDFGNKQVLKGIDLDIPAGQFLAVIGKRLRQEHLA